MIDLLDPIKIGLVVLVFVPGFIFIQIIERHLLREKKPQFEKTLEIILASALIWLLVLSAPDLVSPSESKEKVISLVEKSLQIAKPVDSNSKGGSPVALIENEEIRSVFSAFSLLFLYTCICSFLIANAWGMIRKVSFVDKVMNFLTGRDWFPNASFRFFKENLGKAIELETKSGKYIGILQTAPDVKEDRYIILSNPLQILKDGKKYKVEKLELTQSILISIDEIQEIKSYKSDIFNEGGK